MTIATESISNSIKQQTAIIDLGLGKLVGTDNRELCIERVANSIFLELVITLCFKNQGIERKLVLQFLMPLFAQIGRHNDNNATFALGPVLSKNQPCFDGFSQTHLIGQDDAA